MLRVTIDIREDLITRWGGIFIEGFTTRDMKSSQISGFGYISLPGFEYRKPEHKDESTFHFSTKYVPTPKSAPPLKIVDKKEIEEAEVDDNKPAKPKPAEEDKNED